MSIETLIKRIQNIMRQDAGVDGDAQRISQLVWMLFLKVYDAKEEFWEFEEDSFESIIPEECRWRNWAIDNKDGEALTGDKLLNFVNNTLFPALKELPVDAYTEKRKAIVKSVFEDANNYMKNGTLLRQVINILNEVDFTEYEDRHAFNDIYENILKDLQSAGSSGEFYTPRPLSEFLVEMVQPKVGEKIADFACGTGGFLISALGYMDDQIKTPEEKEIVQQNLFGIEKKPLPYLLAITNMILHDIDSPNILHDNSLAKNVRDYKEDDKYDVIIMNPPYGGIEEESIKINFPVALQSSETADLFMALILYRLKKDGRVAVVLPNNFLFGDDNSKVAIKRKLLEECNLHTIVRLPKGVFEPYTDIPTNLLFFDKTGFTTDIWYFEHPLPEGYKKYSKTKPLLIEEFSLEKDWWNKREENKNAWKVTVEEIVERNYDLDIKNPNSTEANSEMKSSDVIIKEIKSSYSKVFEAIQRLQEEIDNE
ncbi:N-6 DNA methylase [Heyndrickxia oleronia]|uniref:site-specific DNA-methyltransferase (adenine-specific) n=1 Tax=Heyndrickxia oleronia TaxID=38875 RepID=A0A8E2I6Q7_9BACI|nr:N-6 DNA methylase [Heyndrickxia oleronia]MEC1376500.1 N-6 DNA methylase [Heyndrickxia oleronia]OOP67347.1 restriction endonuclease subunit M [Heyndrickxia oleronia]QQZ06211.1 N-6 DNA methylase [Heyndrickxia oleronia]